METVSLRRMKDLRRRDGERLERFERDPVAGLRGRLRGALRGLDQTLAGGRDTRLGHAPQAATRAAG
ncbi:MAG: hypothetical protein R3225_00485 [Halofilum sp. (in: g-proteobacteria)]|nr:hypothetical protein [Halofilum sp. (in: g-proteobacteria)]